MKIALSLLGEHPRRKTGVATTYHEFVARSLTLFSSLTWIVFVGPDQEWRVEHSRVEVVRDFPANDRIAWRLVADHFRVPAAARARGADVMVSTGFVPLRKSLPTAMHVFSLHHLDWANRLGFARRMYRWWETRFTWSRADLVITNSQFAVSQILRVHPGFRSKLVQSYEGLQHEQFNPAALPEEAGRLRSSFGVEAGCFLWLSNFYPYKQADKLLAGYARLDAETRRRHPLVMVGGEWMGGQAAAQEQARALGITDDVKFLGWVGDDWLATLYRDALAHVMPSREETFGRTVIESMACGTPCVANDIPIMREVTAGHALLVDFNQPAQAAEALKRIAADETLRATLRAAGLARAAHFTFEKFTSERIVAIERLVAGKST